jgi:hypothetical protein
MDVLLTVRISQAKFGAPDRLSGGYYELIVVVPKSHDLIKQDGGSCTKHNPEGWRSGNDRVKALPEMTVMTNN